LFSCLSRARYGLHLLRRRNLQVVDDGFHAHNGGRVCCRGKTFWITAHESVQSQDSIVRPNRDFASMHAGIAIDFPLRFAGDLGVIMRPCATGGQQRRQYHQRRAEQASAPFHEYSYCPADWRPPRLAGLRSLTG
jgi:hypothetical protein